jgi:hypothetical protein
MGAEAGWAAGADGACAPGWDAGAEIWAAAGSDGGWESAGCWAAALRESSRPAVTIQVVLRMTLISDFCKSNCSICHLENDVHDCGGIHRLTIAKGWLEAHLVGCIDRRFIQTMT